MTGTIVNAAAVIAGSILGLLLKKGLPEKLCDGIMKALALCTLYIGISGIFKSDNTLLIIVSMAVGTFIGELIDLDSRLQWLGDKLEEKFGKKGVDKTSLSEGFVSASLLFCVGAMAIVGSLQSGLTGDHTMIFSKSLIDCIAAIIFASSLGVGVILSAFSVFIYQGTITLLAHWIAPFLNDIVISQMTAVGCLVMIGLAFNMIGITKIKVMNMIPAIFLPILLSHFM